MLSEKNMVSDITCDVKCIYIYFEPGCKQGQSKIKNSREVV